MLASDCFSMLAPVCVRQRIDSKSVAASLWRLWPSVGTSLLGECWSTPSESIHIWPLDVIVIRPCPKASAVLPRGSVQIWEPIHTSMGTAGVTSAGQLMDTDPCIDLDGICGGDLSGTINGKRDVGVQVGCEQFSRGVHEARTLCQTKTVVVIIKLALTCWWLNATYVVTRCPYSCCYYYYSYCC